MAKALFLAALVLVACVAAHEPGADEIDDSVVLTDDNYDVLVKPAGNQDWFIMFYAPWCGHCKRALPDWYKFATATKGSLNVGRVDCTQQTQLKEKFGIKGFPTILYVHDGKTYAYKGPRTIDAWTDFHHGGYEKSADIKDLPRLKATETEL